MSSGEGTLYVLIVGCEVAFWVTLLSGFACRYLLRWNRASRILLWCVPLVDVALLGFTVLDLRSGTNATFAHGLAMAYVGFTVAFGPMIVGWADQRFAHRCGSGPPPSRPPSRGRASVIHELKLWVRCLFAVGIIYILLSAVIALVGQPGKTRALEIWYWIPLGTVVFWFIFGPLWQLLFFRRESDAT